MPKNIAATTTTSESLLTTSAQIASAFTTELEQLLELREHFVSGKEQFARARKPELFSDELWNKMKVEITDSISTLDRKITYLKSQLALVKKAQAVFASDDLNAIKTAVGDYLKSDADTSLKALAIFRFDFLDIKQSIDEILQYGRKEE